MALRNIQPMRRRLSEEVYAELIDAITRREIGPDDVLIQEKLAAELQISRTPVREALIRLEQEGVLTASKRGSFRLNRMDRAEVRELYQARAAIEGQSARILAAHITPEIAEALRTTVKAEEEKASSQAQTRFETNRAIHRAFVQKAGNRFLLDMFDMIWGKAMLFHLFSDAEGPGHSPDDHMALVDALEKGDRDAALDAFANHIQNGFDRQMETFASAQDA